MQKAINHSIMEVLNREDTSRNPSILFFTDGQSAVNLDEFQKLKDNQQLSCPVHTFGFGQYTSLNSTVLYNIARIFSGYNAYIPDPTNLGTAFVNGIANIMTTAALEVKLDFGGKNSELSKAINEYFGQIMSGDFPTTKSGQILLGQVRYGQPLDILISDPEQKLDLTLLS